ncbi:MAG: alpha/beta hydrolase domain-containing protein [Vicinamibacterales bacterium]
MTLHQAIVVLGLAACATTDVQADVVRLEIQSRETASSGTAGGRGPFEIVRGLAHGEIDPTDRHNTIIQDLELAPRNARGRVEYVATFALAVPVDRSKAARVLLYQVVNRGNGQVTLSDDGYISLISGWQGDLAPSSRLQTIRVPIAKHPDGSAITGPVLARLVDVPSGQTTAALRLSSMGSGPLQYPPAGLSQPTATLTMHTSETPSGVLTGTEVVPRADWAFATCERTPFPGTPDPNHVCVKEGFRADRIYDLIYTARDPLVLGIGLAATRDIVSFFRYAKADRRGTPNPVAGLVDRAVSIGDSQSGNFIKTFIHLGFNEDEANRIVWDGAFPRIAARQTPMNFRFALPGGAATLYEPGSEGVLWWSRYEDRARGLPPASLLDRCGRTQTCPKVIEAFGSTEFWGLRMSPGLIGTDAKSDIPLPDTVRRYYYPGTHHGGGRGGFQVEPQSISPAARCALPDNPNPESDTNRALTRALVEWVANGTAPPDSRYPRLDRGELVPATRGAIGLPDIPGLGFNNRILNPMLHYGFGPRFRPADVSGIIDAWPPPIRQVIPTYVPRVNSDGNEMVGVPSVLHQAPLGTYLGWNVTRSGFFAGSGCGFSGGYLPFARTVADRVEARDPRPSVEERYGTLEGYVCVVRRATERAVRERFLLADDARRLVAQAESSAVLPRGAQSSAENRARAEERCR